jgi:hypothetical protein
MAFSLRRLASQDAVRPIRSAGRTGRHVPRRLYQSRDVLLKSSALGRKLEDETGQKCAIAYIGIFMALSHWRAVSRMAMHVNGGSLTVVGILQSPDIRAALPTR